MQKILENAVALYRREPARINAAAVSAVVFLAAKLGIVISEQDVLTSVLLVLPIVLGGEHTRAKVSPVS